MSEWISRNEALLLGIHPDDLAKFSKNDEIKTDRSNRRRFLYLRDDVVAVTIRMSAIRESRTVRVLNPLPLEKAFNNYVARRLENRK